MLRLFLRSKLADLLAILIVLSFLVAISTGCSAGRPGLFQSNALMCDMNAPTLVEQHLPVDKLAPDADPVARSKAMRASIDILQGAVADLRHALAACAALARRS